MPAITGLAGPLPRAGLDFFEGHGELRAKFLGDGIRSAVTVVILEHEAVAEGERESGIFGLAGNLRESLGGVVLRVLAALVGRKVNVAEAVAAGQGEFAAVLLEPGLQLGG